MKYASKCPKCGGEVQTKNIRKSIGLGFVDIPVAQFCLNPVCDWYQDFSEAKRAEDIKEGVIQIKIPSIKKKTALKPVTPGETMKLSPQTLRTMAAVAAVIVFIAILMYAIPFLKGETGESNTGGANTTNISSEVPTQTSSLIGILKYAISFLTQGGTDESNTSAANTTKKPSAVLTQTPSLIPLGQSKTYAIRFSVRSGFNLVTGVKFENVSIKRPDVFINRGDIVVWDSVEDWQSRVYLVSKENLFEKKRMEYTDKFSYQFNQSGNYTFVLAEYSTLKEFPNTTGRVIVQ